MIDVQIEIPKLHEGQEAVVQNAARFNVLECGRRFGKTTLGQNLAVFSLVEQKRVGWFAPTYKSLAEQWRELRTILAPLIVSESKQEHQLRLLGGGLLDCWSLDNVDNGRGRKYHRIIIDEAGIIRDLQVAWENTLRPTLADYVGDAWFLGTPKGRRYFHRLFQKGEAKEHGWRSMRLPTVANPFIDAREVEAARRDLPLVAFKQEYLGIPADDGGNPFNIAAIASCVGAMSSRAPVVFGVDLAKSQDWTVIVGLDDTGAVCLLDRWRGDWGATRRKLVHIIGDTPALIDSTGVGDPICEDLQRDLPSAEGFKFSANSKQQIMEGLAAAIQKRAVTFPDGWLVNELEAFEYEYTRTGVRYSAPSGLHDDGVCALALAIHRSTVLAPAFAGYSMSGIE